MLKEKVKVAQQNLTLATTWKSLRGPEYWSK